MKQNALFVKGHNTFGRDNYKEIEEFMNERKIRVTYIDYSLEEDILQVYNRMCKKIKRKKFDYLIGHSMGGCLLYHYISKHPNTIHKFKQCILLMPLVSKDTIINIITKIPGIDKISLPKPLIYPKNNLYNGGNIWNETELTKLIPVKQICECYQLLDDNFQNILNQHPNCVLFYASEEKFATISPNLLGQLDNWRIVDGKHECYKDPEKASSFFKALLLYLVP